MLCDRRVNQFHLLKIQRSVPDVTQTPRPRAAHVGPRPWDENDKDIGWLCRHNAAEQGERIRNAHLLAGVNAHVTRDLVRQEPLNLG